LCLRRKYAEKIFGWLTILRIRLKFGGGAAHVKNIRRAAAAEPSNQG